MLKKQQTNDKTAKQEINAKAKEGLASGLGRASAMTGRQSPKDKAKQSGIIGQFLSTKKAEFGEDEHKVRGALVGQKNISKYMMDADH